MPRLENLGVADLFSEEVSGYPDWFSSPAAFARTYWGSPARVSLDWAGAVVIAVA
jgi:hypothetical protein